MHEALVDEPRRAARGPRTCSSSSPAVTGSAALAERRREHPSRRNSLLSELLEEICSNRSMQATSAVAARPCVGRRSRCEPLGELGGVPRRSSASRPRAAASSSASGIPSRRRQISATVAPPAHRARSPLAPPGRARRIGAPRRTSPSRTRSDSPSRRHRERWDAPGHLG